MVTKKETPEVDPWEDKENPVTVIKGSGGEYASITFKAGSGYNAPWLVLKPSSMDEAKEMVQHDDLEELLDLIARKNKVFEKSFGGIPTPAGPAPKASGGGNWGNKSKASNGSSDVPSGTCSVHNCDLQFADAFQKRDGSKVNARVGCPVPKCYSDTVWQNDDGTWGK
jgi:hypothetical protein